MKLRNLCLTAVLAALSLPALAAGPVNLTAPMNMDNVLGAVAADEPVSFQALDWNQDGSISRDEANGTYLAPRFDALDTDHDGQLSPSEVDAGPAARTGSSAQPK